MNGNGILSHQDHIQMVAVIKKMHLSVSHAGNELGQKYIAAGETFPSLKQEAKESFLGLSFAKESLTSDLKFW